VSKILVIGDVIEDVIVIPESEIRPNTDTNAKIHKSMGGQAANVASWISYLGVKTRFVGCVGMTDVKKLEAELSQHGIETTLQSSSKPTGSLVVLVQGEDRSMLTDRGANLDLNLTSLELDGFSVVYLSGYSLLGREFAELESFAAKVHSLGSLLVIDPGSYGFIQDHGVDRFRELMMLADVVLPNLEEEALLQLSGKARLTIVTSGSAGASAHWVSGDSLEIAGKAVELTDPTGAGDAFCAGFLARLVAEPDFSSLGHEAVKKALETAIETGSRAVQLVGARPSLKS
jgi:sugar/nucleoside kinase (ribokinase family)